MKPNELSLKDIFGPLANPPSLVDNITYIIFDTNSTLVHSKIDRELQQTFREDKVFARTLFYLQGHKERLKLEEVIVSSENIVEAEAFLYQARLQNLIKKSPVQDVTKCIERLKSDNKKFILITDSYVLGEHATVHIYPRSNNIRKHLSEVLQISL
jgi:FMN phosphatase YigB (HAD superfamily)